MEANHIAGNDTTNPGKTVSDHLQKSQNNSAYNNAGLPISGLTESNIAQPPSVPSNLTQPASAGFKSIQADASDLPSNDSDLSESQNLVGTGISSFDANCDTPYTSPIITHPVDTKEMEPDELNSDGSASAFEGTEAIDSKDQDTEIKRKEALLKNDPSGRSYY